MKISIVRPQISHAQDISTICATGWKQTVQGKLSERYQKQNIQFWYSFDRISSDIHKGIYSHVALVNNNVVGTIGGGTTATNVGEIFVLYVDETYRYSGIGKQLLEAFSNEQRNIGVVEQWVSVQEGNKYGIPFYEARGFLYQEKKTTILETGEKQVSLRYKRKI
ncbi:GNAT family N-acetyltransferase [Virgibacillus dokdonensis]|uniref:GNAT family N-acetyltransferase n=1 Tax=Virgibacillus dokdonensis TaxID=302167 RepID=A0ABU7VLY3_9BACI